MPFQVGKNDLMRFYGVWTSTRDAIFLQCGEWCIYHAMTIVLMCVLKVCEKFMLGEHDLWALSSIGLDGWKHHPILGGWLFHYAWLSGGIPRFPTSG